MNTGGLVVTALVIAVGLVGILVPLLPGTLLVWAAIAVWAFVVADTTGWIVLGVVTAIAGIERSRMWFSSPAMAAWP